LVASFLTGSDQLGNLTAALIFLYLIVGMTAGAAMLNSWIEERSRAQSPSRPVGRGSQPAEDDKPHNDHGQPGDPLIRIPAKGYWKSRRLNWIAVHTGIVDRC
jgi:hypothetical protein